MDVYLALAYSSALMGLLPVLVGTFRIKSINRFKLPIYILSVISFLSELISYILASSTQNNFHIFHIYTLLEFSLVAIFYYYFFKKYFNAKYLLIAIPIFFLTAYLDLKYNGLSHYDNFATALEALIFSVASMLSFYYIMKKMIFVQITSEPFFWINMGVLLYFGGNFILFIFNDYLLKNESSSHHAMWTIHSVLNIFYNIILAIGFWKTKRH